MNRAIIVLAMQTGITPDQWREADERDVETALHILKLQNDEIEKARKGR